MKIPTPTTIDVETFGIEGRPDFPPVPVGVAIKKWGRKAVYYGWGHVVPAGPLATKFKWNNAAKERAVLAIREAYLGAEGMLFHNGKFDLDVIETHLGLQLPPWQQVHETMFLAFLSDPHARKIDLKGLAAKRLGMPPGERDALADWLLEHQPVPGIKISKSPQGKEPPGKYIAYAPAEVVGPYAIGDVDRTEALFRDLYPEIVKRDMLKAYDRERRLVPVLIGMERRGVPVDRPRLEQDVPRYQAAQDRLEAWVRQRLGIGDDVNIASGAQLLGALRGADLVDETKLGITPKGNVKTDRQALNAGVTDKQLSATLGYLSQLRTCLNTFMVPWLDVARRSGGLIFTNWHQTRGGDGGTRTGRFSSSDTNFQNIPKEFEPLFWCAENRGLPKPPFKDLPPLPMCRSYVVPFKGHVLVGRDYSQQEPRILGHFEDGELCRQYQENPWIDYHDNAKDNLERIFHRSFKRKPVKNINLGIIYGQGVGSLAAKNGESVSDTKQLKDAIFAMYPGLKSMYEDMRRRARLNEPIRTWGGREYYCEPPMVIDGRLKTFDYKMVNLLIQGSAADCTKEAVLRFVESFAPAGANDLISAGLRELDRRGWWLILQVHDEIVLIVPADDLDEAQERLRLAMESVEFDVPILSEGGWSAESWASMSDYDKKGTRCAAREPACLTA